VKFALAVECLTEFCYPKINLSNTPFLRSYVTHLVKRLKRSQVKGISLQLQEMREKRDDHVPDISALDTNNIELDEETKKMLASWDMLVCTFISFEFICCCQSLRLLCHFFPTR
jgi:Ribosomal S17